MLKDVYSKSLICMFFNGQKMHYLRKACNKKNVLQSCTLFFSLNICDRKVGFYFFKSKLYSLVTLIIKNPKFNIIKINFTDYNLFFFKEKNHLHWAIFYKINQ